MMCPLESQWVLQPSLSRMLTTRFWSRACIDLWSTYINLKPWYRQFNISLWVPESEFHLRRLLLLVATVISLKIFLAFLSLLKCIWSFVFRLPASTYQMQEMSWEFCQKGFIFGIALLLSYIQIANSASTCICTSLARRSLDKQSKDNNSMHFPWQMITTTQGNGWKSACTLSALKSTYKSEMPYHVTSSRVDCNHIINVFISVHCQSWIGCRSHWVAILVANWRTTALNTGTEYSFPKPPKQTFSLSSLGLHPSISFLNCYFLQNPVPGPVWTIGVTTHSISPVI